MKINHRISLLILPALLLGAIAIAGVRVIAADNGMPQAGQKAPAFTLPDQDGKTHTLNSFKGHVLVLAFYP
ncbi:MAG TPA: redoxin domain-containing protein, partial [Capsulimonadaceae bacterium]|nr:redoxin domain-containing protein [Capsulimonadaceae bacterium]